MFECRYREFRDLEIQEIKFCEYTTVIKTILINCKFIGKMIPRIILNKKTQVFNIHCDAGVVRNTLRLAKP